MLILKDNFSLQMLSTCGMWNASGAAIRSQKQSQLCFDIAGFWQSRLTEWFFMATSWHELRGKSHFLLQRFSFYAVSAGTYFMVQVALYEHIAWPHEQSSHFTTSTWSVSFHISKHGEFQ